MSEMHLQPAAVLARGLSIGHGRETVVANLDFRLEPGKTLALVGSNGSGKTTLLKTLAGLLPPLAGTIEVLGGRPLASPARVAYMGAVPPLELHAAATDRRHRAYGPLRLPRATGTPDPFG